MYAAVDAEKARREVEDSTAVLRRSIELRATMVGVWLICSL